MPPSEVQSLPPWPLSCFLRAPLSSECFGGVVRRGESPWEWKQGVLAPGGELEMSEHCHSLPDAESPSRGGQRWVFLQFGTPRETLPGLGPHPGGGATAGRRTGGDTGPIAGRSLVCVCECEGGEGSLGLAEQPGWGWPAAGIIGWDGVGGRASGGVGGMEQGKAHGAGDSGHLPACGMEAPIGPAEGQKVQGREGQRRTGHWARDGVSGTGAGRPGGCPDLLTEAQ